MPRTDSNKRIDGAGRRGQSALSDLGPLVAASCVIGVLTTTLHWLGWEFWPAYLTAECVGILIYLAARAHVGRRAD